MSAEEEIPGPDATGKGPCRLTGDKLRCAYCGEEVGPNPKAFGVRARESFRLPLHQECAVRLAVGPVGHLLGLCSCFGGDQEDPPFMTRREAARAAMALFLEQNRGEPD